MLRRLPLKNSQWNEKKKIENNKSNWILERDDPVSERDEVVYTRKHITTANIFKGFESQSVHTSTQDGQPRRKAEEEEEEGEEEEEEEAALFFPFGGGGEEQMVREIGNIVWSRPTLG